IPYSSELTFPVQFSKIDRLAASRSALVYITILSFLRQHFFSLFIDFLKELSIAEQICEKHLSVLPLRLFPYTIP
ncbi:MAG TPA: hypothetical protein H9702_09910, partial [Candidatus Merdibacter merdavium]|nr:hypothetical protein [Candidatus Merdibacter merdavium]